MLRLALETIAVSRWLWLEAGMANSSSNHPRHPMTPGKRRSSGNGLLDDSDPSPQTMILDDFADNNIQRPLASGRIKTLRQQIAALTLRVCGNAWRTGRQRAHAMFQT